MKKEKKVTKQTEELEKNTTEQTSVVNENIKPKKKRKGPYQCFFKRLFDILFSLLAIIVLSPVYIIIYLLSLIILGGNPIFKQYRFGKKQKVFAVYKFRSMTNKKDKDGNLLPDKDRMTKWGSFLRKTSLDELPQFFNILFGQMSFIGPRPRMIQECVFLDDSQKTRFEVTPGITGWAQVHGRNLITFDKVVEYDKYYVEHLNMWMDIKIVFKTIGYVFGKKGINKEGTVSNEFHGDYLLRTGEITQEYYDEKIALANKMIETAKNKKSEKVG